jgi:hypothetical protein
MQSTCQSTKSITKVIEAGNLPKCTVRMLCRHSCSLCYGARDTTYGRSLYSRIYLRRSHLHRFGKRGAKSTTHINSYHFVLPRAGRQVQPAHKSPKLALTIRATDRGICVPQAMAHSKCSKGRILTVICTRILATPSQMRIEMNQGSSYGRRTRAVSVITVGILLSILLDEGAGGGEASSIPPPVSGLASEAIVSRSLSSLGRPPSILRKSLRNEARFPSTRGRDTAQRVGLQELY